MDEDWPAFFSRLLTGSGAFRLGGSRQVNDTTVETFTALRGHPDTLIEVGYLSPTTLIYLNILNPATPGHNRQQEIEHLYRYEFDNEKQYGPPGLEFNDVNRAGIEGRLAEGFHGTETVYYRDGRPVRSVLTTSTYPDSPAFTFTYRFDRQPFWRRLLDKFRESIPEYDEVRTISLNEVFAGLKSEE